MISLWPQRKDSDMTALNSEPNTDVSRLTPAEHAILGEALTGASAKEIADRVSVSQATVRSHLSSIYAKLGVGGRVGLLAAFRAVDPQHVDSLRNAPPVPRTTGGRRRTRFVGFLFLAAAAIVIFAASVASVLVVTGPESDLPYEAGSVALREFPSGTVTRHVGHDFALAAASSPQRAVSPQREAPIGVVILALLPYAIGLMLTGYVLGRVVHDSAAS
jgi:DNA-binding CsgD family transcriptional regulator